VGVYTCGIVESSRFEERLFGGDLLSRHYDLVDVCVDLGDVHEAVCDQFDLPLGGFAERWVRQGQLNVKEGLYHKRTVGALAHEAHVDGRDGVVRG